MIFEFHRDTRVLSAFPKLGNILSILIILWALVSVPVYGQSPKIVNADYHAVPRGETITLTGSGFTGTNNVRFNWAGFASEAVFQVVDDSTLKVEMPALFQDIREQHILVVTETGATLGLNNDITEHRINGVLHTPSHILEHTTVVVRSGGVLYGDFSAEIVVVEAGGVFRPDSSTRVSSMIVAMNGSVLDLSGLETHPDVIPLLYGKDAQIIGTESSVYGTYLIPEELPEIIPSYGAGTFTTGMELPLEITGAGEVIVTPYQKYYALNSRESITLTAVPGEGIDFVGWTGAVNSGNLSISVRPTKNMSAIRARFSAGWVLKVYEVPGVQVGVEPLESGYASGTEVTLTATIADGYDFLGWGIDADGESLTTSVTMDGHKQVIPIVRPAGYDDLPVIESADMTIAPAGGTITLEGSGLADVNSVDLSWAVFSIPADVSTVSENSVQFIMPELYQEFRDHHLVVSTSTGSTVTIYGNWHDHAEDPGGEPPYMSQYDSLLVSGGTVLSGESYYHEVIVEAGGVVIVGNSMYVDTIIATDGAVLDFTNASPSWHSTIYYSPGTVFVDGIMPSDPYGEYLRPLPSIRPSYGLDSFAEGSPANIQISGWGTVRLSPDLPYYRRNTRVEVTAIPDEGSSFLGWTGQVVSGSPTIEITIRADSQPLTAVFATGWILDVYDVPGVEVSISPDYPEGYADNQVIELTADILPGYEFLGWGLDLVTSSDSASLTMDSHKTVIPMVRPLGYEDLARIDHVDQYVVPTGETVRLTGTALGQMTDAWLIWAGFTFPAELVAESDHSVVFTMPELYQEFRDHTLIISGASGSSVAIGGSAHNHTVMGPPVLMDHGFDSDIVRVRAGALLTGSFYVNTVIVEAGGIFMPSSGSSVSGMVIAEDGAVLDFRQIGPTWSSPIFYSMGTVIIGDSLPSTHDGQPAIELPSIRPSFGLGHFSVGYPLNLKIEGPGTVTVNPQKDWYKRNESIQLTAIPDEGAHFIRWIGRYSGHNQDITLRAAGDSEQIARFSTAPDYFSTWRLLYFTPGELTDPNINGLNADPDGDQLTNAAEYAFGTNPREHNGDGYITVRHSIVDGHVVNTLEYTRPKNALDVEYRVLVSSNLMTWNFNGDETDIIYSSEVSVEDIDEFHEYVIIELFPDMDAPVLLFVKLDAVIF